MSNDEPVLKLEIRGAIAEIRFNRPKHLNALNAEVSDLFARAIDQVLTDPVIRVIVLSGEGRAFMAGGDLSMFREADDKPAAARVLIDHIHGSLKRLAAAPHIVIARVQGAVAGAGMSFALAADLAIAADNATLNMAYAKIGASPDCGASWALPRIVGTRKALEIALLSETIDAQEALRLGLVNRVVPLADLNSEVETLAQRLAAGPSVALGKIKHLVRDSQNTGYTEQLDREGDSFAVCAATEDFAGALSAFFNKQKPEFHGR
jgi:2-(1,2-epoxy-1,2-dihydrophenyl)acetyl-CoA isomerase